MCLFSYSWKFNIEFGYHTDETTRIDRIIVSQPTDYRRYLQVLNTRFYSFDIMVIIITYFNNRKRGWNHADIEDNLDILQQSGIVKPVDGGGYTRVVLHDKVEYLVCSYIIILQGGCFISNRRMSTEILCKFDYGFFFFFLIVNELTIVFRILLLFIIIIPYALKGSLMSLLDLYTSLYCKPSHRLYVLILIAFRSLVNYFINWPFKWF